MTTPIWYGPYLAAAVLLAAGGAMKLARPDSTARALRSAGLPHSTLAVRAGSTVELGLALAAIAMGGTMPAIGIALSYLAFAAFIALAHRRGGTVSSCGCFGEVDTRPTVLHFLLNIGAAATAVVAAPAPPLGDVITGNPLHAALLCALTILLAYLAYLAMAVLPKTSAR